MDVLLKYFFDICHILYADSVAPDQPVHSHSLILELHCPLTSPHFTEFTESAALRPDCLDVCNVQMPFFLWQVNYVPDL